MDRQMDGQTDGVDYNILRFSKKKCRDNKYIATAALPGISARHSIFALWLSLYLPEGL